MHRKQSVLEELEVLGPLHGEGQAQSLVYIYIYIYIIYLFIYYINYIYYSLLG